MIIMNLKLVINDWYPSIPSFCICCYDFFHHYSVDGIGLFHAGGSCGVSFFMILSGFVMSAGYGDKAIRPDFNRKKIYFQAIDSSISTTYLMLIRLSCPEYCTSFFCKRNRQVTAQCIFVAKLDSNKGYLFFW